MVLYYVYILRAELEKLREQMLASLQVVHDKLHSLYPYICPFVFISTDVSFVGDFY